MFSARYEDLLFELKKKTQDVQYYSSTLLFLDRLKSLPTNRDPDTPYALQESQGESFDNVNK